MMNVFKRVSLLLCVLCAVSAHVQASNLKWDVLTQLRRLRNEGKFVELFTNILMKSPFEKAVANNTFHEFCDADIKTEVFFAMGADQWLFDKKSLLEKSKKTYTICVIDDATIIKEHVENAKYALSNVFIPQAANFFMANPALYETEHKAELVGVIIYAADRFAERVGADFNAWRNTMIERIETIFMPLELAAQFFRLAPTSTKEDINKAIKQYDDQLARIKADDNLKVIWAKDTVQTATNKLIEQAFKSLNDQIPTRPSSFKAWLSRGLWTAAALCSVGLSFWVVSHK